MLHHVSLEIPPGSAEATADFFELLGFERVDSPEALGGAVSWLERAGTQIHLISTEGASVPALGHAAVVAPDFEEAIARLEAAGHEVERARELWGKPRAFAISPTGHRVELMAAPPS